MKHMAITNEERKMVEDAVDTARLAVSAIRLGTDRGIEPTPSMVLNTAAMIEGLCDIASSLLDEVPS
jgi:hypothetical protein